MIYNFLNVIYVHKIHMHVYDHHLLVGAIINYHSMIHFSHITTIPRVKDTHSEIVHCDDSQ